MSRYIISSLSKCFASNIWPKTRISSFQTRSIYLTSPALAEPPRKKRRLDPAVLKTRVERKIRKLEREIGRIERQPRQPIPLSEYNLQPAQIREYKKETRQRSVSEEEFNVIEDQYQAACKLWSVYRLNQARMEQKSLKTIMNSQDRAIRRLKSVSPRLYQAIDEDLVPYNSLETNRDTPPDSTYTPPDGYIKDVTRKWIM